VFKTASGNNLSNDWYRYAFKFNHNVYMEKDDLINRWRTSETELPEPVASNPALARNLLEEQLVILHRLNGLGVTEIDGHTIIKALEQANFGLRQINKQVPATV
jgi:hypothetical protein